MDAASWQKFFRDWPADVPHRGILVATFEQIPFEGFAISPDFILLERKNPDTLGARKIAVAYSQVQGVKFIDVLDLRTFAAMGFAAPLSADGRERRKH